MMLAQQIKNTNFWFKWCLFNFLLVALVGVLMRYNIWQGLLVFQHKFMQQSHSHFAFYGWVSAAIYALVYYYFKKLQLAVGFLKYELIMVVNQIGAYGMLFSFLKGGYYGLSIFFSALSFLAGVLYFIFLVRDTAKQQNTAFIWLKVGAFFAVFSSIGIFGLSYFTSKRETFEVLYRASMYFYLHFQYNGFFLFSCLGLFFLYLQSSNIHLPYKKNKNILYLLAVGTFFGYGLSTLWIETPRLLLLFWFFIAAIQLYSAYLLVSFVYQNKKLLLSTNTILRLFFWVFSAVFVLKFILPFLSLFPTLTAIAFFNLNIVMAYLHLILLVGFSVFLVWYIFIAYQPKFTPLFTCSVYLLLLSILLNELFLAFAGATALFNFSFITAPFWLFVSGFLILVALFFVFLLMKKQKNNEPI
ncbi:hypothetical protein K5I29_00460 [Flavobacterium agricola]|uniref:Uncharacterized protein n=1 Tax=Flavobacterium agricola TaxID=2870839 RepID=A0ABY6LYQ1_9FLAO|nr:hypothetical protein [Flavobacterium agricola]UYW01458.1 hypothetical protein K5I29_00460 [Flavobacterium agricola]